MTDRKVLCTTEDGGAIEVQACLEALGETGVVLSKKE